MKRKCREGNRRERELTRLILTALILGSGCLYGPVAEAATLIEVTDSPYYINTPYAGQLKQEVNKVVHAVTPDVAWTLNSTNSGWNTFSISGGYITNDYEDLTGYSITLAQGKVVSLIGGWASSTAIPYNNHVYMTGGEADEVVGGSAYGNVGLEEQGVNNGNKVNISGGKVNNAVYGGSGRLLANNNTVTITGGTLNTAIIYGGDAYDTAGTTYAKYNTVNINNSVSVAGIIVGKAVNVLASGDFSHIGSGDFNQI